MGRTAVVLGAGGLVGEAFEAGVLSALDHALGWDARSADLIVGTSAGSRAGALLRYGLSPDDLCAFEAQEQLSESGRALFDRLGPIPPSPPPPVLPRLPRPPSSRLVLHALRNPWKVRAGLVCAALPTGTHDTAPFAATLRRLTGTTWPDEALWIVAARLPLGDRVVFGRPDAPKVDVPQAVSASCAVPAYFAPVEIEGARYVDGGVHSPTNADLLADDPYDTVIVVSPMSATGSALRTGRVHPFRVYCTALLAAEARRLRRAGSKVITFQPDANVQRAMGVSGIDDSRCPAIAHAARDQLLFRFQTREIGSLAESLAA